MILVAAGVVWLLLGIGAGRDQLDAIRTGSALAVGLGGIIVLWLAIRRQRSTELDLLQKYETHQLAERVAEAGEQDATARRITDLYVKAVDQLGSDQAPVRLGGLYALERLAQDNPDPLLRQTVVNVICAYLRMPAPTPPTRSTRPLGRRRPIRIAKPLPTPTDTPRQSAAAAHTVQQEREVRLAAERILENHLKSAPDHKHSPFWPDIDLDLTGATLNHFDLSHCRVRTAHFNHTTFFGDVTFKGAEFAGDAMFNGADFAGHVTFNGAFDDLDVHACSGAVADDGVVVAAVHPHLGDARVAVGQLVEYLVSASGVLHGCRGDDCDQQQPNRVGGDVSLAALIFLPASIPWLVSPTLQEVFTLCESMIAAVGAAARPRATRTCWRSNSCRVSVVPSASQLA